MPLRGRIIFSLLSMLFATCFCFVSQIPLHLTCPCEFRDRQQAFVPHPDNGTPVDCFNQTLLSAAEGRVGQSLSRSLQVYSASHQKHIDRLSTAQFYLTEYKYRLGYYEHLPAIFNHSTRRAFMLFPDRYRYYSGDVLASLDATSQFAFFPEDYSCRRFQNIFQPTKIEIDVFNSLLSSLHEEQALDSWEISEGHRHTIAMDSIFGPPYYPQVNTPDFIPQVPVSIQNFAKYFNRCFTKLTQLQRPWWKPTTWIPNPNSAANQSIRTILFALDSSINYIRLRSYSQGTSRFAGILFNAVLEAVGLPSLNIQFGDETWAWYTSKAVDEDLEPLLNRVLDELVFTLGRKEC